MQTWLNDLRGALRQLRQSPGLALLAILTLALGIGANTAIFTVIESVLLRPLPYPHADRLLYIGPADTPGFGTTSWLNYRDIRDQSQQLKTVAAYSEDIGVVETQNASQSVAAPRVTPNLFSMLDVQPLLGRTFTQSEGEAGASDVVLLSEGVWRQSFQADPAIVGKVVKISGKPHTVVGVMPSSFLFPESMEPDIRKAVWLPMKPTAEMSRDRGYHFQNVVGELRPGITTVQAQRELDAIAAHIPKTKSDNAVAFRATPYQEVLTGPVRPILYSLLAALVLVLLIACANVSNLLIARCLGRQKEFAVRAALGASRLRLVRQLLCEGMMLSLAGCGVGVILAQLAMVAMRKLPRGDDPESRFHCHPLDGCAGPRCHRDRDHGALFSAARVAGGSRESASGIAGGLPRYRLSLREQKAEWMAGRRRGCSLYLASGWHWPALSHAVESATVTAWFRNSSGNNVFGYAPECCGL